ncbi:hypothetical protein Tco_0616368 [Tanacetum coccineum]
MHRKDGGVIERLNLRNSLLRPNGSLMHVDASIKLLGKVFVGLEKGPEVLKSVPTYRGTLVDDSGLP